MANEAMSLLDRVESITASRRKAQTQRLQKFAPLLQQAIQGEELKRKEASDLNYWQNRASVDGIDIGKYTESGLTPQQGYDIGLREKQAEDARNAPLLAEKKRVEANVNRLEQDPMFAEYSKQFPMGEKDSDVYIGEFNEYKNKKALVDAQSTDPTYQVFAKGFDVNNASMEDTQMHIAQFKGWKAKQKALLEAQDVPNEYAIGNTLSERTTQAEIGADYGYLANDSRELVHYNRMIEDKKMLSRYTKRKNKYYDITTDEKITDEATIAQIEKKQAEVEKMDTIFKQSAEEQKKQMQKQFKQSYKLDPEKLKVKINKALKGDKGKAEFMAAVEAVKELVGTGYADFDDFEIPMGKVEEEVEEPKAPVKQKEQSTLKTSQGNLPVKTFGIGDVIDKAVASQSKPIRNPSKEVKQRTFADLMREAQGGY